MRVWKWLADEQADRGKVWGMERKDKIDILLYEMIDKVKDPNNNAVWKAETFNWYTEIVLASGATSLAVGVLGLATALLNF